MSPSSRCGSLGSSWRIWGIRKWHDWQLRNYDEQFDLTFIDKLAEQDVTLDYLKVMIKLKKAKLISLQKPLLNETNNSTF